MKSAQLIASVLYAITHWVFLCVGCVSAYHGRFDVAAFQIGIAVVFGLWADTAYRNSKERAA